MSRIDYIVLALVALAVLAAALLWRASRKKGRGCGGDCAHCHHSCG